MGIFNFLKRLRKERKIENVGLEKLAFSEIGGWIENKIKENEAREKEILVLVKDKIRDFNSDLRTKIIILQEFDVESKKDDDKIKGIVSDGRAQYIEAVDNLMANLENLRETKFSDLTKKIDKIFFSFNKASFKNYERATILIGKEMANIKNRSKIFSKDLLEIFEESEPIIDSSKNLFMIKEKLNTIIQIDKTLEGINEKKSDLNKRINEKEKENRILKENLEKIKAGPVYLENLSKQKKIESLRDGSKKDILRLKQLINFKALANFFHMNEEQMRILKDHKENFHANFKKDNGKMIIDLLDESKLDTNTILEKVEQIRNKIEEIENYKREVKKDETQEVYVRLKEVGLEIDNLNIEKVKEEKREEKLKTSKEDLINVLKQELGEMNVELV